MTIKWTPEGKVDRDGSEIAFKTGHELADALDEAVAALRHYAESAEYPIVAQAALRKLGVEP